MKKQILIFDTEIIGKDNPVFLVCVKNTRTKETFSFWEHKRGHMAALQRMVDDPKYTWVGFNSARFDAPLLAAALHGHDASNIKIIATQIVEEGLMPWDAYNLAECEALKFDHIDLFDVAPGVKTSLKTYAGRMFYPSMVDLPFHHNKDLTPKEQLVLEKYCLNDLGVTEALWKALSEEAHLREELSAEHDLDLRSKSDAQIAEAILKKAAGIHGKAHQPSYVEYNAPRFITTKNEGLASLIHDVEQTTFKINYLNGSPILPEWLANEQFEVGAGAYQVGIGGLHSTHDKCVYHEANENYLISDFDVGSYYPSIMLKCGYVPKLGGNKGELFLAAYEEIYHRRIAAKKASDKKVANSLKITLNGTFGKLGSNYCSFYSPDLMLAVTITGQLNLLCLIVELEKIRGVTVLSANTDGIVVGYAPNLRDKVLKVFSDNVKRTDFEYEEKQYRKIAMKDVNNYIAIDVNGEVKAKGLYAKAGLMKNPTMPVCSMAATQYLLDGTPPEKFIKAHARKFKNFVDFTAIRNVKGGGIQHDKYEMVDDWELIEDRVWYSARADRKTKRVSRPAPVEVGVGGAPFGRVARWYMTTESLPPLTYCDSGNKVPKTEGAKICMILPTSMPKDLDIKWYIDETYNILDDIGVKHDLRKDKAA